METKEQLKENNDYLRMCLVNLNKEMLQEIKIRKSYYNQITDLELKIEELQAQKECKCSPDETTGYTDFKDGKGNVCNICGGKVIEIFRT